MDLFLIDVQRLIKHSLQPSTKELTVAMITKLQKKPF